VYHSYMYHSYQSNTTRNKPSPFFVPTRMGAIHMYESPGEIQLDYAIESLRNVKRQVKIKRLRLIQNRNKFSLTYCTRTLTNSLASPSSTSLPADSTGEKVFSSTTKASFSFSKSPSSTKTSFFPTSGC
jgi:hypothetical protein